MKLRFSFITIFFVMILFTNLAISQSTNVFFKKDFIFDDEAYKITAQRNSNSYQFKVKLNEEEMDFEMVELEDGYIFNKKLSGALKRLNIAKENDYQSKSSILNDSLKIINDSLLINGDYQLSNTSIDTLSELIFQLSSVKGCDSVFVNRPFLTYETYKDSSSNVYTIFSSFKQLCKTDGKKLEEEKEDKLLKISLSLFDGIKKNDLIDKEDASEAGTIIVYPEVKFYLKQETKSEEYLESKLSTELKTIYSDPSDKRNEDFDLIIDEGEEKERELISYELKKEGNTTSIVSPIPFIVDSVQFKFEGDQLGIKAIGKIGEEIVIFTNLYPISFSTKFDGNSGVYLFSVGNGPNRIISTNDLFLYNFNLLLYTDNSAPRDQVVYVTPEGRGKVLFKERNSQILKTKVFTDFLGLRNDEPNGILQLEFSKPISIYTKPRAGLYTKFYYQWFSTIEPTFTLNKIEDDDNQLPVIKIDGQPYVSYNDLLRFRKTSLGAEVNVLKFGIPNFHSKLSLLGDLNYSLVDFTNSDTTTTMSLIDTTSTLVTEEINENRITHLTRDVGLSFKWDIFPSDKYQLSLKYSHKWFKFFPKDDLNPVEPFVNRALISEEESNEEENRIERYHTFELLGTARLSPRGDLFFRGRYHFLAENSKQQFFQIQLGYSYFFFSKNN